MSVTPTSRSTTATATGSDVPILRRNASRGLRLAAFFTMAVTGPYAILLLAAIILSAILHCLCFPSFRRITPSCCPPLIGRGRAWFCVW